MRHETESGDAAGHFASTDGHDQSTRRAPGTNSEADAGQTKFANNGQARDPSAVSEASSEDAGHRSHTKGQFAFTRVSDPLAINQLAELQVSRLRFINAVNRLDNAAKAVVRRALGWEWDVEEKARTKLNARAALIVSAVFSGKELKPEDATVAALVAVDLDVYRQGREPFVKARKAIEKDMRKLAHTLHVWPWVETVRGFGDLALAMVVAEAGDLADYPSVDKLWKRFGLTPYNGCAAATWRRKGGLTAEEWEAFGYRPRRNAESYAVLGDPLFRQQTIVGGPYRAEYDRQKARFLERGEMKLHSHMHGLRCMRKAAIEDLWRVWNGRPPKERAVVGHVVRISDQGDRTHDSATERASVGHSQA